MKRDGVVIRAAVMAILFVAAAVAAIAALNQDQIPKTAHQSRTYNEVAAKNSDVTPPKPTEAVPCGGPGSGYTVITCNGKQHCVPIGTICCGDGVCAGAGSGYQCVRCADGSNMCLPFGSTCKTPAPIGKD